MHALLLYLNSRGALQATAVSLTQRKQGANRGTAAPTALLRSLGLAGALPRPRGMPGQRGACWALQSFAPQLSPAAPVQCIVVIVVYSAPVQPGNAPEQCMLGNVLHNFPNRSRMVPFQRRLA